MIDWISVQRALPKSSDADEYGCVLVWHRYQGAMVMGWREAARNHFVTHWAPTPQRPEETEGEDENAEQNH